MPPCADGTLNTYSFGPTMEGAGHPQRAEAEARIIAESELDAVDRTVNQSGTHACVFHLAAGDSGGIMKVEGRAPRGR